MLFPSWLAAGLVWILSITSSRDVHPGYFRSCLLIVLGLVVLALLAGWDRMTAACRATLIASAVFSYLGFVAWQLGYDRLGRTALIVLALLFATALWMETTIDGAAPASAFLAAVTAALFLGASMGAMLLGHYYLTAPGMPIRPLVAMVVGVLVGAALRAAAAILQDGLGPDVGTTTWLMYLGLRWIVGIAAPVLLSILVLRTLRIGATQSATGILYVLVIFTFIGEGTNLMLGPSPLGAPA